MVLRVDPISNPDIWAETESQDLFRYASPYWLYGPVKLIDHVLPINIVGRLEQGKYKLSKGMSIGQTMHTPGDITIPDPDSLSRPYAGYLYYGSRFTTQKQDAGHQFTAELQLGLIGPFSFGEAFQKRWHDQLNSDPPLGWDTQLERTPIVNLITSHTRYSQVRTSGRIGTMGHLKGRLVTGNMMTFGGVQLGGRFGGGFFYRKNDTEPIADGAGPTDSAPTPLTYDPTSDATDEAGSQQHAQDSDSTNEGAVSYVRPNAGWYIFARSELRAVAHNFLVTGADGNYIDHEVLGADVAIGIAARYDWVELAVQFVMRRHEIKGRSGWPHRFASIRLSILPK